MGGLQGAAAPVHIRTNLDAFVTSSRTWTSRAGDQNATENELRAFKTPMFYAKSGKTEANILERQLLISSGSDVPDTPGKTLRFQADKKIPGPLSGSG